MSLYKKLTALTDTELCDLYKQFGSITKVQKHVGFARTDPRAQKHIKIVLERSGYVVVTAHTKRTDEEIQQAVDGSICYSDVLRYLGIGIHGSNQEWVKTRIERANICTQHFDLKTARSRGTTQKWTSEQIFCANSKYHRPRLASAALKYGIQPYRCDCGNEGEWRGKKLTLPLDHINGINNDNRKENLRWLCPNCHSQTRTFAGRNGRTVFPQSVEF